MGLINLSSTYFNQMFDMGNQIEFFSKVHIVFHKAIEFCKTLHLFKHKTHSCAKVIKILQNQPQQTPSYVNYGRVLTKAKLLLLKPHPFICQRSFIGKKVGNRRN